MIYILMGKSSTGKDTIYNKLFDIPNCVFKKIILYTTRPKRNNEINGKEYYFVTEEEYNKLNKSGKIIEKRSYNTVNGIWRYFTVNININPKDIYITIGTLESFKSLKEYYKNTDIDIIPIYIYIDDFTRINRAIYREFKMQNPNYKEICRRYIADEDDFSEEKLREIFNNDKLIINYKNNVELNERNIKSIYNKLNYLSKKINLMSNYKQCFFDMNTGKYYITPLMEELL